MGSVLTSTWLRVREENITPMHNLPKLEIRGRYPPYITRWIYGRYAVNKLQKLIRNGLS